MDINTRVKIETQKLIHGKGITIFELAERINKSYSYLCRIASPTEELPTPIEVVLPAMKIRKNYGLLKLLAWECGFALVKLPRPAKSKKEEMKMTQEYQKACNDAVGALIEFLEEPTDENHQKVEEAVIQATREGLAVKKYCDKKASKQLELPFNEE